MCPVVLDWRVRRKWNESAKGEVMSVDTICILKYCNLMITFKKLAAKKSVRIID